MRALAPTCAQVAETVDAYLDGLMPGAEQAALLAHLSRCEGCRRFAAQMTQTIAAVRSLSPDDLDANA